MAPVNPFSGVYVYGVEPQKTVQVCQKRIRGFLELLVRGNVDPFPAEDPLVSSDELVVLEPLVVHISLLEKPLQAVDPALVNVLRIDGKDYVERVSDDNEDSGPAEHLGQPVTDLCRVPARINVSGEIFFAETERISLVAVRINHLAEFFPEKGLIANRVKIQCIRPAQAIQRLVDPPAQIEVVVRREQLNFRVILQAMGLKEGCTRLVIADVDEVNKIIGGHE